MAEAQPQAQRHQPQGQQPSGQATQGMQRRGEGQQTGLARRGGGMPSLFSLEPFEMVRMSPFALLRRFIEDMEQQWGQLGMGQGRQGMATTGGAFFSPPMEVFEREGHLVVRADLPGLTKDDVHVEVTDEALTIEGERRAEHEERQGGASTRSAAMARSAARSRSRKASTRSRRRPVLRTASWRSPCPRHNGRRVAVASRFKVRLPAAVLLPV